MADIMEILKGGMKKVSESKPMEGVREVGKGIKKGIDKAKEFGQETVEDLKATKDLVTDTIKNKGKAEKEFKGFSDSTLKKKGKEIEESL